ncbi:DgyrCDS749 [Dimorphilus gyrociliatus]|uniref:DgyrCDS749 n=1 Tax=Dimorphilus gyrociliatus TaxID=2664684 RepID=A0A7I8V5B2_9ANNE|nr:DgyrCDS749 [Dimorphilus gyrociliatus]
MYDSDQESTSLLPRKGAIGVPKDRLKIVYAIFYLLGIGTLLPWNFFINGKHYFMYKLRNITLPKNFTEYIKPEYETDFQVSFESYLAVAAMLPNVLFMFLNTVATRLIRLKIRIIIAVCTMILIFASTIVFALLNTDMWQVEFFAITLVCIVIMNAASAVLQGGVFGLASMFPPRYSQSVMAGQGFGGTMAAIANIISIAATKDALQSGLFYFSIALIVLILAFLAYLILPCLKFARYHTDKKSLRTSTFNGIDETNDNDTKSNVAFTKTTGAPLWRVYRMPKFGSNWLPFLSVSRIIFIPLFIFCNFQPRQHLNVYFDNDIAPAVIMVLFAFTNGYLSTLCMMYGPMNAQEEDEETAGALMSFFLALGLTAGSFFSFLLSKYLI